jgi:hypothetical protein
VSSSTGGAKEPSSFRDPSGFLFRAGGVLYRQVNERYREHYDHLLKSGLFESLVAQGLLVAHQEADIAPAAAPGAYKVIRPEVIPFISYPYEWCFSQLKSAAEATLAIQRRALEFGMALKDASAYNIQFRGSRPVLIDTLSFEKINEGQPWVAYRQFCQHFLAPLVMMARRDVRLSQLLRVYIDGIPLDLASEVLPWRTRFSYSLLSHIHLHAKSQKHYADRQPSEWVKRRKMSHLAYLGLLDNLESTVRKLTWALPSTEWSDYYEGTNYSDDAFEEKKRLVGEYLRAIKPSVVWDLGANTGVFSRIASGMGIQTVSFDIDPVAVEKNYRECVRVGETGLLPLLIDLANPSPGMGWANSERMTLSERGPADAVIALALIHHLAISNNLPFERIASYFSRLCRVLVIEFVPKSDSQVQRLLTTREDIFCSYDREAFEAAFGVYFRIRESRQITGSDRTMYLMDRT